MDRRIDSALASRDLARIMDRATQAHERFIVDRHGEPAVVILSVADFVRAVAPPPDWLETAWRGATERGLDSLTPEEIDAEIAATRAARRGT